MIGYSPWGHKVGHILLCVSKMDTYSDTGPSLPGLFLVLDLQPPGLNSGRHINTGAHLLIVFGEPTMPPPWCCAQGSPDEQNVPPIHNFTQMVRRDGCT